MSNGKVEEMLTQLTQIVGNMQSDFQEMKGDIQSLKDEFQKEKEKNEERHKELLGSFKSLENDQDFIWEKTVRNEREIANIKGQLSNQ